MTRPAADILEEARQLPAHMQRWLAQELLDPEADQDPETIEAAWGEEINRRLDEIDSGAVQLLPWHHVREEMLAKLPPELRTRLATETA